MKTMLFFFLAISLSLTTTACVDDTPYVPRDTIKPEPIRHAPPPPPPPPLAAKIDRIYKVVEHLPRFPGCEEHGSVDKKNACAEKKLYEYIYKNLEYPAEAKALGIRGTVIVSFVVEKDGTVSTVKIIKDIGYDCGEAAANVIQLMNKQGVRWVNSTSSRGQIQRVLFNVPVVFE